MLDLRNRTVWIGAAASGVWLLLIFLAWLWAPELSERNLGQRLISIAGSIAPLILIWLIVWLRHEITLLRNESEGLRIALSMHRDPGNDRSDSTASGQRHTAAARPATAAPATRGAASAKTMDNRQASLGLDTPPLPQISGEELVQALNFPNGPDDHATIAALRKALQERDLARLIRAAQDVVTLMASHGLYMDNMPPRFYAPALWREYIAGARGMSVVELALDVDDASLQTAARILQWDEVFRDAAHHFLRQFDRLMSQSAEKFDDPLLAALADTRSGRAFTLLSQVTGAVGERISLQRDTDQDQGATRQGA